MQSIKRPGKNRVKETERNAMLQGQRQMAKRLQYNPLLKSYPDSDKVNALSLGAETLYTRLIAQSDDNANYWGEPAVILAKLMTQRMVSGIASVPDVKRWVEELCEVELARIYVVGGKKYLHLIDCYKTLRKDVQPNYTFPLANKGDNENVTDPARIRNESVPGSKKTENENGPLDPLQTHSRPTPDQTQKESSADADSISSAEVQRRRSLITHQQAEDLYRRYPKHVGKDAAMKAIKAAVKRLVKEGHDDPLGFLTARVMTFRASEKGNAGDYTPNPATWFNQGRYHDDPATWGTGPPSLLGADDDTPADPSVYSRQAGDPC